MSAIGKVIAILTTIAFARWMGPANLGSFSTFMAIVGLLAAVALLGFPTLQMRDIARQFDTRVVDVFTPITITGFGLLVVVLSASFLFALILQVSGWMPALLDLHKYLHILLPLALIGSTLPAYASQTLVGMGYARAVTLIDQIVRPLFLLALAVLWMLISEGWILLPKDRILLELLVAVGFGLFLYGFLFKCSRLSFRRRNPGLNRPVFFATWLSAFSFAGIGLSHVLFATADILVLGFFVTAEEVGFYKVASAAALLLLFPMNSMSSVYAPHIAQNAERDVGSLNDELQRLTLVMFIFSAPLLLVFLVYPSLPINFVFGPTFTEAAVPLSILALGVGAQLAIGPVGWALTMTGHEKVCMKILLVGAIINVVLNLLLIPKFQLNGAAVATAVSTVLVHVLMMVVLKARTGLSCSVYKTPFRVNS